MQLLNLLVSRRLKTNFFEYFFIIFLWKKKKTKWAKDFAGDFCVFVFKNVRTKSSCAMCMVNNFDIYCKIEKLILKKIQKLLTLTNRIKGKSEVIPKLTMRILSFIAIRPEKKNENCGKM